MSHILVGFSTKHDSLMSRAICWLTRWRHSHVVLISPDRTLIAESTGIIFPDPLTGELRDGVRIVPKAYLMQRDMVEIRSIEHPNPAGVWQEAVKLATDKARYDHEYLGAWLLGKGNGDEQKITCNELIEIAAARAGHALFPDDVKRTSPRDLYLLSKEI
jgi:hypothetical protein